MRKVLVTGSQGFIGRNLITALYRIGETEALGFDIDDDSSVLNAYVAEADYIVHLAGVNRPRDVKGFAEGNFDLTRELIAHHANAKSSAPILFASSIQAELDNPYGVSKRQAEDALLHYAQEAGARVHIFRLQNVFGKWCRPNYNSVVATFCHNIANDKPIEISNEARELELIYIDDVVQSFIDCMEGNECTGEARYLSVTPSYKIALGKLAKRIYELKDADRTRYMPDLKDDFTRKLYATYASYADTNSLVRPLDTKVDERGVLAEFVKSDHLGQFFVFKTKPGHQRGNHFHDRKVEKFFVVGGSGIMKFRHIATGEVVEYPVSGEEMSVVDIPPGYIHAVKNTSNTDLIIVGWVDEVFDPEKADTYAGT